MNLHKKQYILSSHPLTLDGMIEYPVCGAYLYVDNLMQCQRTITADGIEVYLLGHAYCMDIKDKVPIEEIRQTVFCKLENLSHNWTGRWLIAGNCQLITDASCLMSVFYHCDDKSWLVSSSLALLSRLLESPIDSKVNSTGLTWQFLPGTLVEGVKALFCTQCLEWSHATLSVNPIKRFSVTNCFSTDEKVKKISAMLQNALWNISKYSGKNVKIALTAGKDSRLVLSAALASSIPFETYTAIHPSISDSDRKLPIEISRRFDFKHILVNPQKYEKQKENAYLEFCGKNSHGADMFFYANGQFDGFTNNDIIIRSGIFEASQHYARTITSGSTINDLNEGVRRYYNRDMNARQTQAFDIWLEHAINHPIPNVDVRDRFYIEQRVNGWGAAIEQSMDINDFTSIQIANCTELISILLSATDEERSSLALSFEPIRLMAPELMEYPVNKRVLADTLRIYKNGIVKKMNKILRCG